jgi:hypothetical protein
LIVGVEIDDYDNFTKELFEEGGSYDEEMSRHDLERLYNLALLQNYRQSKPMKTANSHPNDRGANSRQHSIFI